MNKRKTNMETKAIFVLGIVLFALILSVAAVSASWVREPSWDAPGAGGSVSAPALADLDGDGDYDLLMGEYVSAKNYIYAYENTGDVNTPAWTRKSGWDPTIVESNQYYAYPAVGDLDGDGDYDLLIRGYYGYCSVYENTGGVSSPVWTRNTSWDPPDIPTKYDKGTAYFADMDNDGDLDLLIGQAKDGGNILAYENNGTATSPAWTRNTAWEPPAVGDQQNPCPALADLDEDGDYDLLIGIDYASRAYENTGSASSPVWTRKTEWDAPAPCYVPALALAFADLDGDGDSDLMIVGYGYKNAKPDLTVTGISHGNVFASESNTISATVENIGSADVGAFIVSLSADGTVVDTATVSALVGGASEDVSFSWTPSQPGSYTLNVFADCDLEVGESDETNNNMSKSVNVAQPGNVLHFVPDNSSAGYCESVDVELIADVNATNPIIATSVNVTFDPSCIDITGWAGNSSIWTGGTTSTIAWSIPQGFIKITTARMGGVSGSLNLGTFTLHCNCTEYCKTDLNFTAPAEYTTAVGMETIIPAFDGGTFTCTVPVEEPDLNVTEKYEEWVDLTEKTYSITYTVENNGSAEAGASNTTITIDGVNVLEDSVPGLATGANYTNTVGPFTMSGNSDTIKVCADSDNVVAESDEANNCMENVFVYPGMPDLNVTEKFETLDDGNFTVTYTVKNIGGAEAGASNTTIFIDGTPVMEDPAPTLTAGANYTNTVGPFDCPCNTSVTVTVCADNEDVVAESDETNNCMENELECPGIPDLVVEKSVTFDEDGNFIVSYTVTNQGCGPAGESTTCKFVNGERMESQPCPALGSGENYNGTFEPEPCPCGETLNVTVCADNENVVAESDETNNCEVNVVECPGIPDLVVEKSVTFDEDGNFIVSYTVTNQGCGPAGESTTCKFVNGERMESQPCPALGSGENYNGTFEPEPCPCGETLNVTVCADNDDVIAESDETNNCEVNVVECPVSVIPVDVDVKPGSCPNPLNLKSKGVLPVAVLGTAEFDVTTIDPGTIQLNRNCEGCVGVAPIRWSYEDVATPFTGELCDCHDLNGDGYIDLTLKFDTQELVSSLQLDNVAGETIPLALTGNLKAENGGTPIEGKDCIRVK